MKKVADNYHLQLRGSTWYYVRRVPSALVHIYGPVVKMSLHTNKKSVAKRMRSMRDVEFDAKFAKVASSVDTNSLDQTNHELSLDELLDYVRLEVSSRDARSAKLLITEPPCDAMEKRDMLIDAEIEREILTDLDDPIGDQTVRGFVSKLLAQVGLEVPEHLEPEMREVGRRALIELNRRKLDRYADRFDRPYYDPLFSAKRGSISFQKLAQEYGVEIEESHQVNDVGLGRREKVAAFLATLIDIVGPAYAVDQFDDEKVQEVRSALARMPANRTKIYPGMSVAGATERAQHEKKPPISATTQEDYLRVFKDVLKFAARRKYLAIDPSAGAKPLKKAKPLEDRKIPFTNAQLRSFFGGSFYHRCVPGAHLYDKPDRDWRFWMPLLMLFSGARPNELAQLRAGDIRESENGNPYLNLFPDADGEAMNLKTRSSRRRIPIHSELIKFGLLEFVKDRLKQGGAKAKLFPTLNANRLGNYAHYASKRFNEVFLPEEIDVGSDQSLYSFRHNVRDALRRIHAPPDALRAICGWSDGGKNASDYYGDATNPDHYVKWVNGISYPGLDLSFLHV